MSIGLVFWILMLIWAVFGLVWYGGAIGHYGIYANGLLMFILLLLLGWKTFGPPVHG